MKKSEMLGITQKKVEEYRALVAKKAGNLNPDYYKTRMFFNLWCVIEDLLGNIAEDDVVLDDESIFLAVAFGANKSLIIREGDEIGKLLETHQKLTWSQAIEAGRKQGFKLVDGKFARA